MTRQPNAVDFWRGFALITIFINHIPGNFYGDYTHRNFSMSDSADLFVFLAGWGLRLMVGRADAETPIKHLVFRLGGRAIILYAAQMLMVIIALAMIGFSAGYLENPLLLEWNNAAAVFYNPVEAHIGIALLTHQLGYFDILPLYVVLMLLAPLFALIHRLAPNWLLPVSLAVYALTLVFRVNLPTWPVNGQWFFNPLCWQLVFVLGFAMARERGPGEFVRRHIRWIRLVALPILIACGLVVWYEWWFDLASVPEPKLFFLISKTFWTPVRALQFLALVAVFSAFFPTIQRWLPRLVGFLTLLGRNSLQVFCVGSLLSLAGQIIRFGMQGGVVVDTVMVVFGIAALGLAGWLTEWRDRLGGKKA